MNCAVNIVKMYACRNATNSSRKYTKKTKATETGATANQTAFRMNTRQTKARITTCPAIMLANKRMHSANGRHDDHDDEGQHGPDEDPRIRADQRLAETAPTPTLGLDGQSRQRERRETAQDQTVPHPPTVLNASRKQMTSARKVVPSIRPAAINIAVWIVPAACG